MCACVYFLYCINVTSTLISEVFLFGTANGIYLLSYINECCACCNIFAVLSIIDIYLEWLNAVEKHDRRRVVMRHYQKLSVLLTPTLSAVE